MAKNEPKIYKHSNAKTVIGRVIAIFIAAVIILALTAFFGFRKFIAYTETGKLYLDIPWLYGYMAGPPAEDDLAPYLEPINKDPIPNVATKVEETEDEDTQTTESDSQTSEDGETSNSGIPQYVDPNADEETTEE